MVYTIIVSIVALISMIALIIIKPSIRIRCHDYDTFYLPILFAAILLLFNPAFDKSELKNIVLSNSKLNPIKILLLFISISFLSISLDESGFFSFIATRYINRFKRSQYTLFFSLYLLISILTIFTSNDIVILTFTPFILYFSKRGNINPIPYLVMEFVAANTYSIILPIGNPTNIYLSSIFSLDFITYVKHMLIPAFLIGLVSLSTIFILFRKDLKKEISVIEMEEASIKDKVGCIISLITLISTTILLVISNYIDIEMWIISSIAAISLLLFLIIYTIIRHDRHYFINPIKRIPFSLIPFILSMFVIILSINQFGIFNNIYNLIENVESIKLRYIIYLFSSTLSSNVVNNIPMTIAFGSILLNGTDINYTYLSIIGSNIGAILTPLGALAGIMWMSILKHNNIKYRFIDFTKNGLIILSSILVILVIYILIV